MRFKLMNNVISENISNAIRFTNTENGAVVDIKGNLSIAIRDILNGEDSLLAIENFANQNGLSVQTAQYQINSLMYALLRNDFITNVIDSDVLKSCVVEIIDRCNFKCSHCYKFEKKEQLLSLQQIKELAKDLVKYNCAKITLTGGEVLLHPDFADIYLYLYKKGFIIGLNTNGALLSKFTEIFKDCPPYAIEVSLYGYNQETYSKFTGNRYAFSDVDESLRKCKEYKINVSTKGIIVNSNYAHFGKIREYAKSLGLLFRSDYITFPQVDGNTTSNSEQIDKNKILTYLKNQKDAENYYIKLFNRKMAEDNRIFRCKKRAESIFINSKLNVSICVCAQGLTCKYEVGKLKECIDKINHIIQTPASVVNKCSRCKFISICRYCPARFYLETRDYEKPPNWCCELTNEIYTNFISGFRMLRKLSLTEEELDALCEIETENMKNLGMEINKQDKILWQQNMKNNLENKDFLCFVGYLDGKICCFVTFLINNNKLWVSEFELNSKVQNTKIIYKVIKHLCDTIDDLNFENLYFKINKTNYKSSSTFSHIGATIQKENEKSFTYELKKEDIVSLVNRLETRQARRSN